jgi:hypothetical protein
LFASADSVTAAELVGCAATALRLDRNVRDPIPYYMLMLDRVRKLAKEFDILHFHIDQFHFPLFAQMADRTVTTLHGRQDLPDLKQETLAEMIGTTRSRVSFFINKFRKLGFIEYNGKLEVHNSLLNVVLHDNPQIRRDEGTST